MSSNRDIGKKEKESRVLWSRSLSLNQKSLDPNLILNLDFLLSPCLAHVPTLQSLSPLVLTFTLIDPYTHLTQSYTPKIPTNLTKSITTISINIHLIIPIFIIKISTTINIFTINIIIHIIKIINYIKPISIKITPNILIHLMIKKKQINLIT